MLQSLCSCAIPAYQGEFLMHLLRTSKAALFMIMLMTVAVQTAHGQGDPHKVKHVIVIMQENHSSDGINPGHCADLSNPPSSLAPGKGAECSANLVSLTDTTVADAATLCPEFAKNPTRPFPAGCANFDQYGI